MHVLEKKIVRFPWKAWLLLAAMTLGVQIAIDAWMGIGAEYFNAAHVFLAWGEMLTGSDPQNIPFLMGQETLGRAALPLASLILVVQPSLSAFVLIWFWRGATRAGV